MKAARNFSVVLVTAPNLTTARKLAKAALISRNVACANLLPKIESHYWWQGRLDRGNEVLILLKTSNARLSALEKIILENHPYDTPEILVLPVSSGTERYLAWLRASLR